MRSRRRLVVLLIAILAALAAGGAWAATRDTASATPAATEATVTSGTVKQTVSASGTIASAHEADLSFAVSGTVNSVKAAVGDKVTKGQALASVDSATLASAVTLAEANLASAKAAYTSTVDDSASSVQIASAKAQVAAAESSLSAAKAARADATLRSTITGTVASVGIEVGDSAGGASSGGGSSGGSGSGAGSGSSGAAGTSSGSSTSSSAQVVVISTSAWVVDASVGSADLASLKKGMQAVITPTGAMTPVFGTVKSIGVVASTSSSSSASASFPVVVAVTGNPRGLYSGGSATVAITVKQLSGVLSVPSSAIHTSGSRTYVYQMSGGRQVATTVTLGTTYGRTTAITTGLKAGDTVVVPATVRRAGGTGGGGAGAGGGAGGFGGGAGGFGGGAGGFGGGAGGFGAGAGAGTGAGAGRAGGAG